jgi:monoamine oxidase
MPTLEGWIGGQEAIDMEAQTDEEILDNVMTNLQSMFPTITRPDRVIISRWGQEPNVRGTYCFKQVGRHFSDDTWYLQENVDRIWFAGEATSSSSYGTAQGAWKSGDKAAREMKAELRRRLEAPATQAETTSWTNSAGTKANPSCFIKSWYSALLLGLLLVT